MTTTTSPNNVDPRTLNIEQSSPVEHRTSNLEHPSLRLIDPLGYFDIIALEKSALRPPAPLRRRPCSGPLSQSIIRIVISPERVIHNE